MSFTATVGFFPANGNAASAIAMGDAEPAATEPLGVFGALLQLVSSVGDKQAPVPAQGTGQGPTVALGSLFERLTTAVEDSAPSAPGDGGEGAADQLPTDLLAELSKVLDAIAVTAEAATPLDPSLESQATALVEAMAAALGVPLPVIEAAKVATPAVAAVANAGIELAAATASTAPGGPRLEKSADGRPQPAVAGATTPDVSDEAAVRVAPTATPELPPIARELANRLAALAAAIEPKAQALAERIAALGTRIASGEIDLGALTGLGQNNSNAPTEDWIDPAILRLLTPVPDPKAAVAPKPFAAATLELPPELGTPGKPATNRNAGAVAPSSAIASVAAGEPGTEGARRIELPVAGESFRPDPAAARPVTMESSATTAREVSTSSVQTAPNASVAPGFAALATLTADARAVHAAYSAPVQQINIPQVAFEIVRQVQAGATRFQIRLDPPELGRIDVKLDLDAAGNINARMTVDRAETLDLMQRDHRALERALAQAGLDTSKTNLEFSLRQNPFSHQEQQHRHGTGNAAWTAVAAEAESDPGISAPSSHIIAYRGTASPGGVNLFV